MTKELDSTDIKILELLEANARASYTDIANAVGLSRTSAKARIDSLEEQGVIKGYTAVVDRAGNDLMSFIVVAEIHAEHFEKCKTAFAEAKETVTLVQTTGGCRLVAICAAPDVQTMRDFINGIYKNVGGFISINANSVIDAVKGSLPIK
jgi:Lrp/AsnC family leucine-responsive transcriptional regulator